MKNHNIPATKTIIKRYRTPLPKHLHDVTVDQIFWDTKYCIGLMGIFFTWSGEVLRQSMPGSKLKANEFEDNFHDAFEMMIRMRIKGKIRATSPRQLYCFLRAIFRNIVYIRYLRLNLGEVLSFDEDLNKLDFAESNSDNEPTILCLVIDKLIKLKGSLSENELEFWNAFKDKPDKKEKQEVMQLLDISSENYDTLKHRVFRKITSLHLKNLIF